VTPSLQAAVGFTKLAHLGLELGLVLPVAVLAGRADPTDPGSNPNSTLDDTEYTFTKQGVGDLVIHPKIRFMNATRNGIGVAVIPSILAPTGDKDAFLGEGQWIFQPTVVVDTEVGYLGRFRAAINAGMRIRGHESEFVDNGMTFPRTYLGAAVQTNQGIRVGNEYMGGVALSYGIVPQKFDVVGEVYGVLGPNSVKVLSGGATEKLGPNAEAILGIKLYLARNSFFEI